MKKLLLLIIFGFSVAQLSAQTILKGTGTLYFSDAASMNLYTPSVSYGSEHCITVDDGTAYVWNRTLGAWVAVSGGSNTNFAIADLTFNANRIHNLNAFDFRLENGTDFFSINSTGGSLTNLWFDLDGATMSAGSIDFKPYASAITPVSLRIFEMTVNGTDHIGLSVPASIPAATDYFLPLPGSNGQYLQLGTGNQWQWADIDFSPYVQYSDSTTTFVTPTQLAGEFVTELTPYVQYSDSTTTFVTPTQLADSTSLTQNAVAYGDSNNRIKGDPAKIHYTENTEFGFNSEIAGVSETVFLSDISNTNITQYISFASSHHTLRIGKRRGTIAAPTGVLQNDDIGALVFSANGNTNGAGLAATIDGTYLSSPPVDLQLFTSPQDSGGDVPRLTISSVGNMLFHDFDNTKPFASPSGFAGFDASGNLIRVDPSNYSGVGGQVNSVVAGTGINVDNSDPINPVVSSSVVNTNIGNSNLTVPAATPRTLFMDEFSDFKFDDKVGGGDNVRVHIDGQVSIDGKVSVDITNSSSGGSLEMFVDSNPQAAIVATGTDLSLSSDAGAVVIDAGGNTSDVSIRGDEIHLRNETTQSGLVYLDDSNGTQKSELRFRDNTGGEYIGITAPPATTTYTIELPLKTPLADQYLVTTAVVGGVASTDWINKPAVLSASYFQMENATFTASTAAAGVYTQFNNISFDIGSADWSGSIAGVFTYIGTETRTFRVTLTISTTGTGPFAGNEILLAFYKNSVISNIKTKSYTDNNVFTDITLTGLVSMSTNDTIDPRIGSATQGDNFTVQNTLISINAID